MQTSSKRASQRRFLITFVIKNCVQSVRNSVTVKMILIPFDVKQFKQESVRCSKNAPPNHIQLKTKTWNVVETGNGCLRHQLDWVACQWICHRQPSSGPLVQIPSTPNRYAFINLNWNFGMWKGQNKQK